MTARVALISVMGEDRNQYLTSAGGWNTVTLVALISVMGEDRNLFVVGFVMIGARRTHLRDG